MVSILESSTGKFWGSGDNDVTCYGLSTDTKPTDNMQNGYKFIEMDTKKVYIYSESDTTWYEFT